MPLSTILGLGGGDLWEQQESPTDRYIHVHTTYVKLVIAQGKEMKEEWKNIIKTPRHKDETAGYYPCTFALLLG